MDRLRNSNRIGDCVCGPAVACDFTFERGAMKYLGAFKIGDILPVEYEACRSYGCHLQPYVIGHGSVMIECPDHQHFINMEYAPCQKN